MLTLSGIVVMYIFGMVTLFDNDAVCEQSIKVGLSAQIQDGGHQNQVICLIKSIIWDLV